MLYACALAAWHDHDGLFLMCTIGQVLLVVPVRQRATGADIITMAAAAAAAAGTHTRTASSSSSSSAAQQQQQQQQGAAVVIALEEHVHPSGSVRRVGTVYEASIVPTGQVPAIL